MMPDLSTQNHSALVKCFLKWAVSLVIVAFLFAKTDFQQLTSSLANYGFDPVRFSLGFLFCGFSVFLTFIRWRSLLTAFGVSVESATVIRVGLFSYGLNLLALGSVGGDLGRAVLLSRQHPDKREEVALSVAVDRIIGLYAMFVLAFVFVVSENLFYSVDPKVQLVAWFTAAGTFLIPASFVSLNLLIQAFHFQPTEKTFRKKAADLIAICRGKSRSRAICRALVTSLVLRITTAIGIYFLGTSLLGNAAGIRIHLLAASIGLLTGCLPLPFNGLGALETVLEFAFHAFSAAPCPPGYGIAVALLYRTFLLAVGILGAVVFSCQGMSVEARPMRPVPHFDSSVVT